METNEEKVKRLEAANTLLEKELFKMKEFKASGEKYWVLIVRVVAFIIGFLPFIPNTLYYLGFNDERAAIGTSDIFFVAIGFAMLWGSSQFSSWANEIGKKIIGKH